MLRDPASHEIDHHTIKLLVGLIAICLASLTDFFSESPIASISASYHQGGWARDIFVGALSAIAAFLFAYNGASRYEMILSKIAAVSAMGVALFPCECQGNDEIIPYVHGVSAAIMFLVLAAFCYIFFGRARSKPSWQATRLRATIYAVSGFTIVGCILILAIDHFAGGAISAVVKRLVFYVEAVGLAAFGIAWLTASRVLPFFTSKDERYPLF